MKKMGLIGMIAGAMSAVVIGFAGPAQSDPGNGYDVGGPGGHSFHNGFNGGFHGGYYYGRGRDHRNNPWLGQLFPTVKVPQVDTTVRN